VTSPSPLLALAEHCGIQWQFDGSDAQVHTANEDVVRAVLRAWGVEVGDDEDARRLLRDRRYAAAQMPLESVLVSRADSASVQVITLPKQVGISQLEFTLTLEDGDVRRVPFSSLVLGVGPAYEIGGVQFHTHHFELNRTGLSSLPLGYHHAHLEGAGIDVDAMVISAPRCPPAERGWGLFMPLHALRSAEDWGIGSYSDLASLGHWAAEFGAKMVGALPLYPIMTSPPIDPSPYLPASKLAYNELFIDAIRVPEFERSPAARSLVASDEFRRRIAEAHNADLVHYDEVANLKHEVLALLCASLMDHASTRRNEFIKFGEDHPELEAYSHFQLAQGPGTANPKDAFHAALYGQWIAHQQLVAAEREIDLYADLPIGVHPNGFDPTFYPESFVTSAHGGAPPDLFFGGGQDWSFPPLHPERMREDGYAYLRATLRRACRHAGALRVDHVMGIHRLYWIPDGFDAAHGAYVNSHAADVRAIIALEAHLSQTVVIGEDLGTVPPEVRADMAQDHMLRSWVMEFESTAADPLPVPIAEAMATWGTHDLPRFLAFLDGDDINRQVEDGWMSVEAAKEQHQERLVWREMLSEALMVPGDSGQAVYMGCLEWMAKSDADSLLIDLEELWGERVAQNIPGTGTERGNWTRRGALTMEDAVTNQNLARQLRMIESYRRLVAGHSAGTFSAGVGVTSS
jgi:4-alpha-glucanotransferase